jgi:hypothetical protein
LYCADCNFWIKWLAKSDVERYPTRPRKPQPQLTLIENRKLDVRPKAKTIEERLAALEKDVGYIAQLVVRHVREGASR